MSRPKYETSYDKANELVVRDIVRKYHHNCVLYKPTNSHYNMIDFWGFDAANKCIGLFEIKCRSFSWGHYDTVMFSAGKWIEGYKSSQGTKVPFYIIISVCDGTYEYKQNLDDIETSKIYGTFEYEPEIPDIKSNKIFCEWGGRTVATRDPGDLEPVMKIPIELFTKISDESAFRWNHPSTELEAVN